MCPNSAVSNSSKMGSLVTLLLCVCTFVSCDALDHCALNNYRNTWNSTHMQYTREPVNREYAILDQFKSLHCCAKNYLSIEW